MLATFVPDLPVLAAFVAASIVLGITPGPDMTFFLSKTVAQSRPAGFAAFGGAASGLLVHSVLVAAGLSVLLAASATAFTVLKIAGAAYLAWLAVDAIRHGSSLSLAPGGRRESAPRDLPQGAADQPAQPEDHHLLRDLPAAVRLGRRSARGAQAALPRPHLHRREPPVCSGFVLAADRIALVLKRSPRATRIVDWLFAGVLGAFAARLILTQAK